jgi:hypothetical protein
MVVGPATTTTVPSTTAISHQSDAIVLVDGVTASNSAMPPRMPRTAPTRAGRTCVAESPAATSCGVAPKARASADECRASSTIAQVMKIALTAARATNMTVDHHQHMVQPVGRGSPNPEDPPSCWALSWA